MNYLAAEIRGHQLMLGYGNNPYNFRVTLPSGSRFYDGIRFSFDSEWNDFTERKAIFWRSDAAPVEREIVIDTVMIPPQMMLKPGIVHVAVRGAYSNPQATTQPTTNAANIVIEQGYPTDADMPDPSPSVYQQLITRIEQLETRIAEISGADIKLTGYTGILGKPRPVDENDTVNVAIAKLVAFING